MEAFDFKTALEHIKEINKIVETCPDAVKEKCFEMLFNSVFQKEEKRPAVTSLPVEHADAHPESKSGQRAPQTGYKLPSNVLAFSRKYDISMTQIEKLFILDHEPLLPVYKISNRNMTAAQLQKVFMVLLENGLLNNQFKVSYQELRDSCKEDGLFDGNFTNTLKRNYALFKGAIKKDKILENETVELTGAGYETLAETVKTFVQATSSDE